MTDDISDRGEVEINWTEVKDQLESPPDPLERTDLVSDRAIAAPDDMDDSSIVDSFTGRNLGGQDPEALFSDRAIASPDDLEDSSIVDSVRNLGGEDPVSPEVLEVKESSMEVHRGDFQAELPQRQGFRGYVKSKCFRELMVSLIYGMLVTFAPHAIPINWRPIPYQITKEGDVILDQELNNPLLSPTFSSTLAFVVAVLCPYLVQSVLGKHLKHDIHELHNTFCTYIVAISSTAGITEIIKRYVGRLRPNTYAYCAFDPATMQCTNPDKPDWRMSFPSGHSSTSFCGCTLLTLYAWTYVRVKYEDPMKRRPWLLLSLTPLLLAYMIAASRVHDNYHFVGDVVGGSAIGVANAVIFTQFWFPSEGTYSSLPTAMAI